MKRTQVYLDDELWRYLDEQARAKEMTVPELVRDTLREKYAQDRERRKEAFEGVVGLWEDRTDLPGTEEYVRKLRLAARRESTYGDTPRATDWNSETLRSPPQPYCTATLCGRATASITR